MTDAEALARECRHPSISPIDPWPDGPAWACDRCGAPFSPGPIHSVTAEARWEPDLTDRGTSGQAVADPSAAADLPTGSAEAGGLDVLAIEREAAAQERERLAAVFAVAAVRYGSRLKYPDDVWREVQAHLAEPSE